MTHPPPPPRLHVFFAREAPVGLVLRRGPAKEVASILWDRESDSFRLGQWLKGRIYEYRSDLSPDGRHFLYFAMNGRWRTEVEGAWSAISIAPYLKALMLCAHGDCMEGGGLWTGATSYWLNSHLGHRALRHAHGTTVDQEWVPPIRAGLGCPGVYYPRLLRDGWRLVSGEILDAAPDVFEKPVGYGWVLEKLFSWGHPAATGRTIYFETHRLVRPDTGRQIDCPAWEWADIDTSHSVPRLVWATGGKLFAGTVDADGLESETELVDLGAMRYGSLVAPYRGASLRMHLLRPSSRRKK